MKPIVKLAEARTPDGGEMVLYRHDRDFSVRVNGTELMNTRQHESELELARLGCRHLLRRKTARVLIGGLGLGYTLRETLDLLNARAEVTVAELLPDVIAWNRNQLAELNGHALLDPRVEVKQDDVLRLLRAAENRFDSILLDVDNGPGALTDAGNDSLYSRTGIETCRRALRERGCLAVWSVDPSKPFERLLMRCGFKVSRFRVPAYPGSKSNNRFVWVASEHPASLPPGGGEPSPPSRWPPRRSGRKSGRR